MLAKSRPGRIPKCTKNPPLSHNFHDPVFFRIPVFCKNSDGRFLFWKNDYWSIFQSEVIGTATNDPFSNKKLRPPEFLRQTGLVRRGRDVGGDFFLHRDCRFVQIGFSLHRDRGFVEIGFYLHRDCRYIGPCEAKMFSPRFARTRRVYVYVCIQ